MKTAYCLLSLIVAAALVESVPSYRRGSYYDRGIRGGISGYRGYDDDYYNLGGRGIWTRGGRYGDYGSGYYGGDYYDSGLYGRYRGRLGGRYGRHRYHRHGRYGHGRYPYRGYRSRYGLYGSRYRYPGRYGYRYGGLTSGYASRSGPGWYGF